MCIVLKKLSSNLHLFWTKSEFPVKRKLLLRYNFPKARKALKISEMVRSVDIHIFYLKVVIIIDGKKHFQDLFLQVFFSKNSPLSQRTIFILTLLTRTRFVFCHTIHTHSLSFSVFLF